MADSIGRETLEMEPIKEENRQTVGVIGISPGAGATFVCRLLTHEATRQSEAVQIVDFSEEAMRESYDTLLIVLNCEERIPLSPLKEYLEGVRKHPKKVGVVFNRYQETEAVREAMTQLRQWEETLPLLPLPVIEEERLHRLYHFVFHSGTDRFPLEENPSEHLFH